MTDHFNGLTPAQAERLAWLLEELGEAQQAIGKILRHGYDSFDPTKSGTKPDNRDNLAREIADIYAAISLLNRADDVPDTLVNSYLGKQTGRNRYMHHQPKA